MTEVKPLPKKSSQQIVTKNVSAIHIGGRLSLTQRKLVNALLYNAYDTLLVEDTHTISVALLMEMIGFESRNQVHLKKAIRGLTEASIQWDMMADDGTSIWEVATLLSYARIQNGRCTYRYDKSLAEKLHDPSVFAKINLSVVRDIRSAHTLALYENCFRYVGIGQTPKWDIAVFRKLMSVDGLGSYQQFKFLKRDLITPAMKEINKLSNIHVELLTEKKGRSVVSVQFSVKQNAQMSLIGIEAEDEINSSPAYRALIAEGVSKKLARLWTAEHGEAYIFEKVELAKDWQESGRIKSSKAGFLKAAIEEDYHSEKAAKQQKLAAVEQAKREAQKVVARREALEKKLRDFQNAHRKACVQMMENAFESLPESTKDAVSAEFKLSLSSRIYADAYKQGGWKDRRIYTDARSFWETRDLEFPSPTEFAKQFGLQEPDELRQEIEGLPTKPVK